jgi:hypothetical protein
MSDKPEFCVTTVWQARAWREDGSWNHAVLVVPLDETPTGK